ncbi:protein BTR1-like isoform X1 [Olea europaea var. sylvestris]|uniref:protein BTR1-like isoform X1 n=1 Tax=Olea europaea var. sylvestris TaxID=158386 RepID=UPI000C1CCCA6|nr:protein BTR1-like isoform X1 [Olea europaea var. sylvestris]XP_022841458.1 protein BTR1-like isoform X1 [Olea europaea var. sylvestris]XP_022841459.1 protein BTR1-like isoform X1 [Olea europaea var. sylvestris]XP_022841460.1 protein BTR1-like isoform X1 [Olea europaea var. sylvestris]XP_022841462.1 protein BTR1-like isoform X1 [Olea europaea var. sylvestris]XP_022841463.1 protein BTR1-like isoform X1 [Olea europaea var. sylvestris]XP_022841464.1 protein BTR1-like isoform X1 [Olea europaea 
MVNDIMKAIDLILSKLLDEFYAVEGGHVNPQSKIRLVVPNSSWRNNWEGRSHQKEDRSSSLTIAIPAENKGIVVGRGGRSVMEISQLSGARIKISERGDFMSGTSDRKVTISGPQSAIRIAETMILRKVAFITER